MRQLEERTPAAVTELAALRVVAAGGGTGLPRVLAGLAGLEAARPLEIAALVATSDDGGSSGELRRRYGLPAPGDVRNCLVALAGGASPLAELFQHRFGGEGGLAGHTVGNVILAALTQRLGDFGRAVDAAARLLGARGRVLPALVGAGDLVAERADGTLTCGECAIAGGPGPVVSLRLARPAPAPAEAVEAIRDADLVVLGPGSLFSSVLASCLGAGVADALRETRATRVAVVNLLTQPGETDDYGAADHVRALQRQLGPVIDVALVHRGRRPGTGGPAAAGESRPVEADLAALAALGVRAVADDLADAAGARHDPVRLGRALLALAGER